MYSGYILVSLTHAMPRYAVRQLMRKRKEARKNIINSNRDLVVLQNESKRVEQEVNGVNKILCTLWERKRRLDEKVATIYRFYKGQKACAHCDF